jgi:hypothetical protein
MAAYPPATAGATMPAYPSYQGNRPPPLPQQQQLGQLPDINEALKPFSHGFGPDFDAQTIESAAQLADRSIFVTSRGTFQVQRIPSIGNHGHGRGSGNGNGGGYEQGYGSAAQGYGQKHSQRNEPGYSYGSGQGQGHEQVNGYDQGYVPGHEPRNAQGFGYGNGQGNGHGIQNGSGNGNRHGQGHGQNQPQGYGHIEPPSPLSPGGGGRSISYSASTRRRPVNTPSPVPTPAFLGPGSYAPGTQLPTTNGNGNGSGNVGIGRSLSGSSLSPVSVDAITDEMHSLSFSPYAANPYGVPTSLNQQPPAQTHFAAPPPEPFGGHYPPQLHIVTNPNTAGGSNGGYMPYRPYQQRYGQQPYMNQHNQPSRQSLGMSTGSSMPSLMEVQTPDSRTNSTMFTPLDGRIPVINATGEGKVLPVQIDSHFDLRTPVIVHQLHPQPEQPHPPPHQSQPRSQSDSTSQSRDNVLPGEDVLYEGDILSSQSLRGPFAPGHLKVFRNALSNDLRFYTKLGTNSETYWCKFHCISQAS